MLTLRHFVGLESQSSTAFLSVSFGVCVQICHESGDCGDCPRSGVRTCPCGKKIFDGFSCKDEVEVCGDTCEKVLGCYGNHKCTRLCHFGDCGSVRTDEETKIKSSLSLAPKRVVIGGVHLHGLAPGQQASKKHRSGGEPFAKLVSDLTGLGIQPKTSCADNDILNHCNNGWFGFNFFSCVFSISFS